MRRNFFAFTVIEATMSELQNSSKSGDLSRLHASTCLSMTHFINGHHCPKLAQQIVHQLHRLLSHPELHHQPESREMYLEMLDYWQNITRRLLAQHKDQIHAEVYH